MTFEETLYKAFAMLQRHGRVTYGTLKRQFDLDDAALEDLTEALLFAYPSLVSKERIRPGGLRGFDIPGAS